MLSRCLLTTALLGAALLMSACVDEEGGATSDMGDVEPDVSPPSLALGVPAELDPFVLAASPYEFTPLIPGGPLRVEYIPPGACILYPNSIVLLLRSEGFELPEKPTDWDDLRMPLVSAVLSTTDERGEPIEELVSLRDYPVWFEPVDDGGLQGQLWMMPADESRTPAALEGAAVRLELTLAVLGREPAQRTIDLTLEFEQPRTATPGAAPTLQPRT